MANQEIHFAIAITRPAAAEAAAILEKSWRRIMGLMYMTASFCTWLQRIAVLTNPCLQARMKLRKKPFCTVYPSISTMVR